MAFSRPTKPLTTYKILCEAFKLPTKNSTLLLPILLLSFLTSSLHLVFVTLSINPITSDLISKSISLVSLVRESPEYASIQATILNDLKEFFLIEAISIITSFIVSSFITIATIHAFSLTFSGKLSTVRDFLCSLGRRLKGPLITKFYVKLLSFGCFFLLLLSILVEISVFISGGSMILIASGVILALLGLILYLYLGTVWSVSEIISVVEEGCYELEAISKAAEIIKGRRRQGVKLVLIELMNFSVIYGVYNFVNAPSMASQMATGIVHAGVSVLANMFGLAVSMVYYCDCKRSKDGEGIDGGFMYVSLPTAAAKDD